MKTPKQFVDPASQGLIKSEEAKLPKETHIHKQSYPISCENISMVHCQIKCQLIYGCNKFQLQEVRLLTNINISV